MSKQFALFYASAHTFRSSLPLFPTNAIIILQGGVGKTSVRRCYMGDEFRAESLLSTVGVDWDTKVIVVDGVNVTMKIWVCRSVGE